MNFVAKYGFSFPFTCIYKHVLHAPTCILILTGTKLYLQYERKTYNNSPVCSKKDISQQIVVPVDPIKAGLLHLENSCSSFSLWLRDCC